MIWYLPIAFVVLYLLRRVQIRLRLSKAKHPSLRGHAKMSRRAAKMLPFYAYPEDEIFSTDDAPEAIAQTRKSAFFRLKNHFQSTCGKTIEAATELENSISDVLFTNSYRVPFQYRNFVKKHLKSGQLVQASSGTKIQDLDGNWYHDLTGAYGVNLHGYDFYKECIREASEKVKHLGPVLGPYHPVILDNVRRLKQISGLDEVSFHMSGTEAVMQAVRLARYHTQRSRAVVFCGAYHGWWDGVQPGVGNQRKNNDTYMLKEMSEDTLKVLRTRKDIACVLVNPLQALNPNGSATSDGMLVASDRTARFDRNAYTNWLRSLRQVCDERNIVLIFDEVFLGFRLAKGGAQEYFGVNADIVTYGKTLGGGYPVGVVCGKHDLMKRFREDKPADVCFARGTFNSHPYVMAAMNEFLVRIDAPNCLWDKEQVDDLWNQRAKLMNDRFRNEELPFEVANMSSIWVLLYRQPGRYNWMFQYYLKAEGLYLAWIGTGRFIFSHNYSDDDFKAVVEKIIAAGKAMKADGWLWHNPVLTNKAIKRRVAKELLHMAFPWLPGKKQKGQPDRNPAAEPQM